MSLADIIGRMMAAGATPEAIALAIEAFQASQKSSRQARNRRYYEAHRKTIKTIKTSESSESIKTFKTSEASETTELRRPLARVEDNPSTKKLSGKEDKNLGARASRTVTPTPRDFLLECLSPESADAVLAHRKAMRRPLTGRAAQLLAKGFLATADPNAAADMMIERGWQGFKPEWFDNERRSNGQPKQSGKGSIVEAGRRLTARLVAAEREGEMQAERGFGEGDDAFRMLPGGVGKRS
jgi:hypothetical protein